MLDQQAIAAYQSKASSSPALSTRTETINGVEVPFPDNSAFQNLEGDPKGNPLGYAQAVDAVSKHLQEVVSKLNSLNEAEITKAKEVAQLQAYSAIWPQILYHVHKVLPPEDEVSKAIAQGGEKYKELIAFDPDKYARKSAQDHLHRSDALRVFRRHSHPGGLARSSTSPVAANPAQAQGGTATTAQGFFITVEGGTPFENGYALVNSVFMTNLRNVSTAP